MIYIHFEETEKEVNSYKFSKMHALKEESEEKSLPLFSTREIKLLTFNLYCPLQFFSNINCLPVSIEMQMPH